MPGLLNKLIKPAVREGLQKQRNYWSMVFETTNSIRCIYSNKLLTADDFAVEHYIPWRFTTHNLLWNLVPADQSINSSKGDKLPRKDQYLEHFVKLQRLGLKTVYNQNRNHKLFDDYALFGVSISDLIGLDNHKLIELFDNQITPQIILANQLGFQYWQPIL